MHSNWRDCQEWKNELLPMNTTSNEAAKLFDISLSQIVGFYEEKQYGGIFQSMSKMVEADPTFVLGHCLKIGVESFGNSAIFGSQSNKTKEKVDNLIDLKNKELSNLTKREIFHVNAIKNLTRGDLVEATNVWEKILLDDPTDLLALKFAHTTYFHLGYKWQMRDSIARVLPYYKSTIPLSNYLYGMHAFGLTQSNQLDYAEKEARKGLSLNKHDTWAAHAINHVNEYRNNTETGINFLLETEPDWSICEHLVNHNYWHLGLFYLENNENEKVLELVDNHFMKTPTALDFISSSSLLFRLKLAGYNKLSDLNSKMSQLKEFYFDSIQNHGFLFVDAHLALILGLCGTDQEKSLFLKSLNEYIESDDVYFSDEQQEKDRKCYLKSLNKQLSNRLFESIFYYGQTDYDSVVELLYPIRYDLVKIGGSNAQGDLFHQMLTISALSSNNYKKVGLALTNERFGLKPNSNLNKRLVEKFCLDEQYDLIDFYKNI